MPKISWITDPKNKHRIWRPITKREGDIVKVQRDVRKDTDDSIDTYYPSKTDGELEFPVVVIYLSCLHSIWEGNPMGGYATDFEVKPLGKEWCRLTRVGERELAKLKNTMNNLVAKYTENPKGYKIQTYRWKAEHQGAITIEYEREPLPVPTPAPTQAPLPIPEPVEEEYQDESVKNCMDDLMESIRDYVSYDSVSKDDGDLRVCSVLEALKELLDTSNPVLARLLREQGRIGREILGETDEDD